MPDTCVPTSTVSTGSMVPVAVTVFSTVYSFTTWVRITNSLLADLPALTIIMMATATTAMPKMTSHIFLFFFIKSRI